jgi:hypothetical protein
MKTANSAPSLTSFITGAVIVVTYFAGLSQYFAHLSPAAKPQEQAVTIPTTQEETTETVPTLPEVNYEIQPGIGFGDISATSTQEDLRQLFGEEHVQQGVIDLGEGMSQHGTIVFANDPEKRLEILWKDEVNHREPSMIRVSGSSSLWKLPQGITLGTSLKELQAKNSMPFKLFGFYWDNGGTITSWENGNLKSYISPKYQIYLALALPGNPALSSKEQDSITGDQQLFSSNPTLRKLNPKVVSIVVSFMELPSDETSESLESTQIIDEPQPQPAPSSVVTNTTPVAPLPESTKQAPANPELDTTSLPSQPTQNPEPEQKEVPEYLKKYVNE